MFHDLGYSSDIKSISKKKKIDKLNLIKIKNFYASKNIKWEKIFVSHIFDKELRSKIYKELQLNNKKTNSPIKNWTKRYKNNQ